MVASNKYWAVQSAEDCICAVLKRVENSTGPNYRAILERNRNHYYKWLDYNNSETSIQSTGEQGEFVKASCSQGRSLIRNMVTLVTSDRLAFETIATASDESVYSATKVAKGIIDDVLNRKNIDKLQDEAVELALVYGSSFYVCRWNTALGEPYVNDTNGKPLFTGDIDVQIKSPFDIYFDTSANNWEEVDWVIVKQKHNKHTIASQYKKFASELEGIIDQFYNEDMEEANEDTITVYEFYHKPTPALPNGRLLVFVNSEIILFDKANPYKCLPVIPNIPMNIANTLKGYALFSDILPLQELLDSEINTIASNHAAYGVQNILIPNEADFDINDLQGLRIINYSPEAGDIKPLSLVQSSPELFKMVDVYKQQMMEISGINSTVRGAPPSGATSGVAIATLSANALKFASSFSKANQIALERVMELVIKEFKIFATAERTIAILGANKSYINMRFSSADIEDISHVKIRPTNPMSQTLAGRIEIAQNLLQSGLIKNPQDYLKVLETGDLDVLNDEVMSEDELISAENEELKQGKEVPILMLDNHITHLSKHKMLLNNPLIRRDSAVVPIILNHIQEHLSMLENGDPMILELAMSDTISPDNVGKKQQPVDAGSPPASPMGTMLQAAQPTEKVAEPLPLETPLNGGM